jgi:hypothetical protein
MSNAITLNNAHNAFSLVRTTKSGKQVRRDLIGVLISGTPAERVNAAQFLIQTDWENGDMRSTLDNLVRVFTRKAVDKTLAMLSAAAVMNNKSFAFDWADPCKADVMYLIQGLITLHDGAKGEKGKMLEIIKQVSVAESEKIAAKLAREEAFKAQHQISQ